MKHIQLISPSERQGKTCYFCGNKFAKYIFESDEPMYFPHNDIPIPAKVYACNKCALNEYAKETTT